MNCFSLALTFAIWSAASFVVLRLLGGNHPDDNDEK
jgi:hypothetical protein